MSFVQSLISVLGINIADPGWCESFVLNACGFRTTYRDYTGLILSFESVPAPVMYIIGSPDRSVLPCSIAGNTMRVVLHVSIGETVAVPLHNHTAIPAEGCESYALVRRTTLYWRGKPVATDHQLHGILEQRIEPTQPVVT